MERGSYKPGTPGTDINRQKLGERHRIDSPSRPIRRSKPCLHLDFRLLAFRTDRE